MITVKAMDPSKLTVLEADVFGFLGVFGEARRDLRVITEKAISEMNDVITPRACYIEYDIEKDGDIFRLGFADTDSKDLSERLSDCKKIILIAATVGIGADRLAAKYSVTEPSYALIMQAVGSAAVEAWLDLVCAEITEGREARERFSCGYGDLPLELQKDIFKALECEKNIGLTLNGSMLMTPTKSVTAIIGIKK